MNLLKKAFSSSSRQPIQQTGPKRPSPLDIPEILDLIFSFLSDYNIRNTVVRVCRQWYLMHQRQFVREVTWHQTLGPSRNKRALRKFPGASRFYCCFPYEGRPGVRFRPSFDKQLLDALYNSRFDGGRHIRQQLPQQSNLVGTVADSKHQPQLTLLPSLYNSSPLRDMDIYFGVVFDQYIYYFPFPWSLTSLNLKMDNATNASIDLGVILKGCPLLESFSAVTLSEHAIFMTLNYFEPMVIQARRGHPLRSLILFNFMFRQTHLEAMLRHTPNLKQLKLAAMVGANEYRYNWARLFAALKEHNIILNKALFSNCVTGMSAEETELLMTDVYPQSSTELSIWAMDITPRLFQTVLLRSDTLTTLEIWWKPSALSHNRFAEASDQSLTEAYALIHHYLCETLYFAHLTSLKTVLRIQDMDLFDRGQYINKSLRELMMRRETPSELSTPSPSGRPSIWRCRGLRILHIDIHTPNLDEMEDPFYSRIIFGYISRVCPQLEDLQICVPNQYCYDANGLLHYQAPSLQLSAGFCLLGRLSNLQRLRVVSMRVYVFLKCKDWELNWMIDSGRKSAVSRKKRRLAVKSWREMRANENQLEAIRLSHLQLKKETATLVDEAEPDSRSGVVQGGDTNILHRLRNLGLLVDVEEMIKEMDNIEFRPLPSLEWLSLDCPILLRPEEELKRQFAHKKL